MSLTLHCGAQATRFGSYNYVHKVRRNWIIAYYRWAKEEGGRGDAFKEKVRDTLTPDADIDYETFEKLESDCPVFQGLRRFVFHSDYDGTWNVLDSEDILHTLSCLKPYLKKSEPSNFDTTTGKYYLEDILLESVQTGQDIWFG